MALLTSLITFPFQTIKVAAIENQRGKSDIITGVVGVSFTNNSSMSNTNNITSQNTTQPSSPTTHQ
jgi:hypothetical protein